MFLLDDIQGRREDVESGFDFIVLFKEEIVISIEIIAFEEIVEELIGVVFRLVFFQGRMFDVRPVLEDLFDVLVRFVFDRLDELLDGSV